MAGRGEAADMAANRRTRGMRVNASRIRVIEGRRDKALSGNTYRQQLFSRSAES